MDETEALYQGFIFLLAAVITVPIAKRLRLGAVLGYLCAGILIGPFALGLAGDKVSDIMHFAELGVVLMLFLVGLELKPKVLWKQRQTLLGMGTFQLLVTAVALAVPAYLFGLNGHSALAVGLILALSSTAIVLQILDEKHLLKTPLGRSTFSVLLFQDIAVIPILAMLPLLAMAPASSQFIDAGHPLAVIEKTVLILTVVMVIIIGARFGLRPLFRSVANTRIPELFTATALLLVVTIVLLMNLVGLSAALGTFLAGVVLAESEYRQELEAGLAPFKGLLLGLFFISVGAGINFDLLTQHPVDIPVMLVMLVITKALVLLMVAAIYGFSANMSLMFAIVLSQAGEFCFVLLAFARNHQIFPGDISDQLILVVALSMVSTPLLMFIHDSWFRRHQPKAPETSAPDNFPGEYKPIIIAGSGRFGQIVSRMLTLKGYDLIILESDATQLDSAKKLGHQVFYGDASRPDTLEAAGIKGAFLLVVAIDDHDKTLKIIDHCQKHYPELKVLARATGRRQAHEIMRLDVEAVRETFHSGLYMGERALIALGLPAYEAHRTTNWFRYHDIHHLRQLTAVWDDEEKYLSQLKDNIELLEALIKADADADENLPAPALRAAQPTQSSSQNSPHKEPQGRPKA